ncbi:hypothetical protein V7161_27305 [Neobacillus drentensis]|uniref:hypothetical protein n=1 Tax=Bacillales TaxID=1385 RepID=UPI0025B00571|nr:hypothetical protein [Paenibacillus sp. BSR1-1]MDN3015359.1 hypothetical protein [Paenibacillus sp. BSR1-1]
MAITLPACPTLGDIVVGLVLVVAFLLGSLLGARPSTLAAVSDAIATAFTCS